MRKIVLGLVLCLALSVAAWGQGKPDAAGVASSRADSSDMRQQTFDKVWRTIKDKHFDPTFGGVNWDQVRERYAPRVASVKSDQELYDLLQRMLGELKQSHFNIIPPEAIVVDDVEPPTGGVGIDISIIDSQAVITRVEPNSTAERAGLRPGFVIKQVDQIGVQDVLARFAKSKESPSMIRLRQARAVLARVGGSPGSKVRISYLDERDQQRETEAVRERLKGEMSQRFGNFPPQYTEFEAKRLNNGIGYVRFNIFVMSLMEKIRSAIRSMNDAPGLIIDLRGNPGGMGGMSSGIAGLLESKQTSLGRSQMRSGYQNFAVFPQVNPYAGPVVVLIDGGSASTSEVFAAGMQDNGRAIIVGERSMGAVLLSLFEKLPTGALFQYAIADYTSPKGVLIEGRGVKPDVEVKLIRAELLKGRDHQLEEAIRQIQKAKRDRDRAAGQQ